MSNTVNIVVNPDTYTEISESALEGFFTNGKSQEIEYAEGASLPPATLIGHPLSTKDPGVTFKLEAGQKVYAKSAGPGDGTIVVTPQL